MDNTIKLTCEFCKKEFLRSKKMYRHNQIKHNWRSVCSRDCGYKLSVVSQSVECKNCKSIFVKKRAQTIKIPNHFCCQSCAAIYNNARRKTGTRISKLEVYLAHELSVIYPEINFHFAQRDAINGELDIYLPDFKLAFELNGIFHYEPIFGKEKLDQIQNNDQRKFQACLERGIELVILDVSGMKHFSPKRALLYLKIIQQIIDSKLSGPSESRTRMGC